MKVICVDDEKLLLEDVVQLCEGLPQIDSAKGFHRAADALDWMSAHGADLAILDIDMPGMNGIELAMKIKEQSPDTAILFLTAYAQFAVDVIASHIQATGYLLKPVRRETLAAEVHYALTGRQEASRARIRVRTFGAFDLLVDGQVVSFPRARAKELLAYLVDRQGASVTRKDIYAALWEDDGFYDRSKQKYLDVIIRSLRDTLAGHGAGDILEMKRGTLRVCPERFDCDMYRFFEGDAEAVNAYRGVYMDAYSWASMGEAFMDRVKEK